MKIGAAHRNVRSLFLRFVLFCPPIGDVKLSLLFLNELCAKDHFQTLYMEETWLCLTILFIFCVQCANSNGAGDIGALILLAHGTSMRQ